MSGDELKSRIKQLEAAQKAPLSEKIKHAQKIIDDLAKKGKMGIMFSGGRDSCAVALLAKKHSPLLIYCDTGLSTAQAESRVKIVAARLEMELHVAKPEKNAYEMWQEHGHYPIGPKRGHTYLKAVTGIKTSPVQCCYHLKEIPAKKIIKQEKLAVVLWGNRAADSNRRKLGLIDNGQVHPPGPRWPCFSAQPIALFTDADVEKITAPLGQKFTARAEDGCQVCCTDLSRPDNQLTRTFLKNKKEFDNAIVNSGLGQQILKARGEAHSPSDVLQALESQPLRFLRIPAIGRKSAK